MFNVGSMCQNGIIQISHLKLHQNLSSRLLRQHISGSVDGRHMDGVGLLPDGDVSVVDTDMT